MPHKKYPIQAEIGELTWFIEANGINEDHAIEEGRSMLARIARVHSTKVLNARVEAIDGRKAMEG